MADITPLHIPPSDAGAVSGAKPKTPAAQPAEGQPAFKEVLERVKQGADQMEKASSPSFSEVQDAMKTAKSAYDEIMLASQMMQNLVSDIKETGIEGEEPPSSKE